MRKLLSLVIASSFFALGAQAFDEPTRYFIGTDEYTMPIIDESYSSDANTDGTEDSLRRYNCPRGWDRVPTYRWNYHKHRWEFAGYRCRRGRAH